MKKYKWTVEISVDDCWVADGFDMDDEKAQDMLADFMPYAHGSEIKAKVIKRPAKKSILKEQGY